MANLLSKIAGWRVSAWKLLPRQLPIRAAAAEEAGHPYISPRVAVKLVDDDLAGGGSC